MGADKRPYLCRSAQKSSHKCPPPISANGHLKDGRETGGFWWSLGHLCAVQNASRTMVEKTEAIQDTKLPVVDHLQGAEPPRRWTTTRVELWAFYVYYIVSSVFVVFL